MQDLAQYSRHRCDQCYRTLQCYRARAAIPVGPGVSCVAWLTPRQSSSGEKFNSGGITKKGNGYLRKQLVYGARASLSRCRDKDDALSRWGMALVARRCVQKACVAMAARMARLAWTLLNRNEMHRFMA